MITLFLGGANSGKSAMAERCVATLGEPVTYLATWRAGPGGADPAMDARVARHRARRPASWTLRELGTDEDVPGVLGELAGTVLVDALGTWVAGAPGFSVDAAALCAALGARAGATVLVSDEVGLGVHPSTPVGRQFREARGPVNEAVAAIADDVWLVMAGRVVPLGAGPWCP
ncbi:MAG: bifunctional adenosylcobinamide kinase/adenosylcobinamide-phosphate guanylyltransferase [Acidimicrobiales bacterium]